MVFPFRALLTTARGSFVIAMLATFTLMAIAPDASAARRRHKSSSSHYAPPQASIVIDGYSGKIIQSYKADEARYPASITKVMTLYLVFEFIKKGRITLDTELAVTGNAASQSPTKLHLKDGETIAVRDAIRALITKSANDAAVAIAENLSGSEETFARLMTARARSLGMKNTTFRNASGLPHIEQRTTAYDLTVLARAILRDFPEHAGLFQTKFFKYGKKLYKNHNGLLFSYKGADGMKTGFTNASGFNLMTTARRDGKFIVAIVLGGRSSRQRNNSMKTLLNASWGRAKTKAEHEAEQLMAQSSRRTKPVGVAVANPFRIQPAATTVKPNVRAVDVEVKSTRPQLNSPLVIGPQRAATQSPRPAPIVAQAGIIPPTIAALVKTPMKVAPPVRLSAAVEMSRDETPTVAAANSPFPGPFHIQIGAYESAASAQLRLDAITREAGDILAGHPDLLVPGVSGGRTITRARFGAFTHTGASNACEALRMRAIDCVIVAN